MARRIERRLRAVGIRIGAVQSEIAILDQQLVQLRDELEDARLRSAVEETPSARVDHDGARRQCETMQAERDRQNRDLDGLRKTQDQLLDRLWSKRDNP